jgi:hypothetical protein
VAVLVPPSPGQALTLVRITQDGEQFHYWVEPLPSDFGLAYRLEKPGTEGTDVYDVLLDAAGDSCTCKGHTYGGYCKHVDGARALLKAGKLPLPPLPHAAAHGPGCGCTDCTKLAEYKPAGHGHNLPF